MYKWPQGRVIRTICFIVTLMIAADLGYAGYAQYKAAMDMTPPLMRQLIPAGLFAVVSLAALIAGVLLAGFIKRSVQFLIEVEQEMVKVEWPKLPHLVRSTIVIAIAMCLLSVVILGVDAFHKWFLFDVLFKLGDKL